MQKKFLAWLTWMFCPQYKNVIALKILESLHINFLLCHIFPPELVVLHIWCKVVSLVSQFTIFLGISPTFLLFLIYFVSIFFFFFIFVGLLSYLKNTSSNNIFKIASWENNLLRSWMSENILILHHTWSGYIIFLVGNNFPS